MKKTITIFLKLKNILKNNYPSALWVLLSFSYVFLKSPLGAVVFMDVGQGDATLIQKGDFQILVDGGEYLESSYEIAKYMSFGDSVIDVVVLTHPHEDHIGGVLHLLKRYDIGELWLYPVCYNSKSYKQLLGEKISIREVYKGMNFNIQGISIDILWPRVGVLGVCEIGNYKSWDENINNDSIVINVKYLGQDILLMGDAERKVEENLDWSSHIDILKAGHHCSRTSSSETFVKGLRPTSVICSCGKGNKFDHPSGETLERFSILGVQTFVTYESGNIVVK